MLAWRVFIHQIGHFFKKCQIAVVVFAFHCYGFNFAETVFLTPEAQAGGIDLFLNIQNLFHITQFAFFHTVTQGNGDGVGGCTTQLYAVRHCSLPVRAGKHIVTAFTFGCTAADIRQVFQIRIDNLRAPVTVFHIRQGNDDRFVFQLQQRTAVHGIVVGGVGQAVVRGCQLGHMTEGINRSAGADFALHHEIQFGFVQTKATLAVGNGQRQTIDIGLHAQ